LIRLVSLHTGLCVRNQDHEKLWEKIIKRMRSLSMTESDYLKLLGNNVSAAMHEWNELASLLTTGESYFFRDSGQFALLRNRILPELVERNRNLRRLRIWSAGCASCEEPYSISILLNELIRSGEGWRILILGSDINRQAIHRRKMDSTRRGRSARLNPHCGIHTLP